MKKQWWHDKVAYQIYPKKLFMILTEMAGIYLVS